jgi:hypothetical protein
MALDTRDRRASAVLVALPWRGALPAPDPQAETQADRQQVALMVASILAGSSLPPQPAVKRTNWYWPGQRAPANGVVW